MVKNPKPNTTTADDDDAEAKSERERERYTNIQKLNSHHEKRSKLIVMMFFKLTLGLWSGRVWDGEGEGEAAVYCVSVRYSIYGAGRGCRLPAGVGSRSQPCK